MTKLDRIKAEMASQAHTRPAMTNHKPASPLPFKVNQECGRTLYAPIGKYDEPAIAVTAPVEKTGVVLFPSNAQTQRANATYLAHAANAYPKLVERAIALLVRIDNMTSDEFAHGGEKAEREALRSLLSELGEAWQ